MPDYILTCCSTVDMPEEYLERRDIPYLCFHYNIDGEEYPDDLGKTMSHEEFYDRIKKGAMPTTSQINAVEFTRFFEPYLKEGKDILHFTLSSGLSGTFNSACLAREELLRSYPERRVLIVDTLGASTGSGFLVDAAADLRDRGASLEEVKAWAEANKLRIHHWFFTTDLVHLKRGGRVSAASAAVGTILNICPLLNINHEGKLIPRAKIRGKKQVIKEIVKKMEEHADGGLDYQGKCFISQAVCYEDARKVADLIEEKFPKLDGPVRISNTGAVIGAHTGPGTVTLFFFGDKREN